MHKFFKVGLMLASATLATRSFWLAYLGTFSIKDVLFELVTDVSAVREGVSVAIALAAPIDFLTGCFLIFWPFYAAWIEDANRKRINA